MTDLFFFHLSYLICLLLDIFCFSLGLFPSLTVYALCRAPCAIAANRKQYGKFFFLVFSATYALCHAPYAITEDKKQ